MNLRRRIQLIVLGTVLVSFLLAGTAIAVFARANLIARIDDRIDETAGALASAGQALGTDEFIESVSAIEQVTDHPDATLILDGDDQRLYVLAASPDGEPLPLPGLTGLDVAELRRAPENRSPLHRSTTTTATGSSPNRSTTAPSSLQPRSMTSDPQSPNWSWSWSHPQP